MTKNQGLQNFQTSQALADSLHRAHISFQSDITTTNCSVTPDQEDWFQRVGLHFQKIAAVLQNIGSSDTLIGPEWESARDWATIYINLFLAIDASMGQIRSMGRGRFNATSASELMVEIIRGHAFFWASRATKGDWTFSVKDTRDALRKIKKLETTDRLDRASYNKTYSQVARYVVDRIGDSDIFFSAHVLCLLACEREAKKNQNARQWYTAYQIAMDRMAKSQAKGLREGGGRGFGFRNGQRVVGAPGGTYKNWREVNS